MITLVTALLLASPACTEVRQQCRACTTVKGVRHCSGIGIACQPVIRMCKPGRTPSLVRNPDKHRRDR